MATYSAKGIEPIPIRKARLIREAAELKARLAREEAARIAAEKKAAEELRIKQIVARSGKGWDDDVKRRQALAARDIGKIKRYRGRVSAGSGQGFANLYAAKANVIYARYNLPSRNPTIVFRSSEIAKGWHKKSYEEVIRLRTARLRAISFSAFLTSSKAAQSEAVRQRETRAVYAATGINIGTIGKINQNLSAEANASALAASSAKERKATQEYNDLRNSISYGQPQGNTLVYQRAQKIAEQYKTKQENPFYKESDYFTSMTSQPAKQYMKAKYPTRNKKYESEVVSVFDRYGKIAGQTIKQISGAKVTFGGTAFATSVSKHYKLSLFEGKTKKIVNPFVSRMLWGVNYSLALGESKTKKIDGISYRQAEVKQDYPRRPSKATGYQWLLDTQTEARDKAVKTYIDEKIEGKVVRGRYYGKVSQTKATAAFESLFYSGTVEVLNVGGMLLNVEKEGGYLFAKSIVDTKEKRMRATRGVNIKSKIPEGVLRATPITPTTTITGELAEGVIEGTVQGVSSSTIERAAGRNRLGTSGIITGVKLGDFSKAGEAGKKFWEATLQNPFATAGEVIAIVLPVGATRVVKVVPFTLGKGTIQATVKSSTGQTMIVEQKITSMLGVGWGTHTKPILHRSAAFDEATGKFAKAKFGVGSPKGEQMGLKQLTTEGDRGFELGTQGAMFSNLITSKPILAFMKKTGKFTDDDIKLIQSGKVLIVESKGLMKKRFRTDFTKEPITSMPKEDFDIVLAFAREKKFVFKGSLAQIPTYAKPYAHRAVDFDADIKNFLTSKRYTVELAARLNKGRQGDQFYVAQGGDLFITSKRGLIAQYPDIKPSLDTAYHGTSRKSAESIKAMGIDLSKSKSPYPVFFGSMTPKLAGGYAKRASGRQSSPEVMLKLNLKKQEIIEYKRLDEGTKAATFSKNWQKFHDNIHSLIVKTPSKTAATKPYYAKGGAGKYKGTEILIEDPKVVKSVEEIPAEYFTMGGKGRKVGQFLSPDDPLAVGQLPKSKDVFGKLYPKGYMKTEGARHKTAEFQITAKGASVITVQKDPMGKLFIAPPSFGVKEGGRLKDFPDFYGGGKTAAIIYKEVGLIEKSKRFDVASEEVKRIGSKYIDFDEFYKSRKLVEWESPAEKAAGRGIISTGTKGAVSLNLNVGRPSGLPVDSDSRSPFITRSKFAKSRDGTRTTLQQIDQWEKQFVSRGIAKGKSPFTVKTSKSISLSKVSKSRVTSVSSLYGSSKFRSLSSGSLSSASSPSSSPSPYSPSSPYSTPSPTSPPSPPTSPPSTPSPPYSPPYSPPSITSVPSIASPPPPTPPPTTPVIVPAGLLFKRVEPIPKRRKSKPRADFLGSAHVARITGFARKQDIIYGREKTYKLVTKDILESSKGKFAKKGKRKVSLRESPNLFSISRLSKAQLKKEKVSIRF